MLVRPTEGVGGHRHVEDLEAVLLAVAEEHADHVLVTALEHLDRVGGPAGHVHDDEVVARVVDEGADTAGVIPVADPIERVGLAVDREAALGRDRPLSVAVAGLLELVAAAGQVPHRRARLRLEFPAHGHGRRRCARAPRTRAPPSSSARRLRRTSTSSRSRFGRTRSCRCGSRCCRAGAPRSGQLPACRRAGRRPSAPTTGRAPCGSGPCACRCRPPRRGSNSPAIASRSTSARRDSVRSSYPSLPPCAARSRCEIAGRSPGTARSYGMPVGQEADRPHYARRRWRIGLADTTAAARQSGRSWRRPSGCSRESPSTS